MAEMTSKCPTNHRPPTKLAVWSLIQSLMLGPAKPHALPCVRLGRGSRGVGDPGRRTVLMSWKPASYRRECQQPSLTST
jgi:hypothetical protein